MKRCLIRFSPRVSNLNVLKISFVLSCSWHGYLKPSPKSSYNPLGTSNCFYSISMKVQHLKSSWIYINNPQTTPENFNHPRYQTVAILKQSYKCTIQSYLFGWQESTVYLTSFQDIKMSSTSPGQICGFTWVDKSVQSGKCVANSTIRVFLLASTNF